MGHLQYGVECDETIPLADYSKHRLAEAVCRAKIVRVRPKQMGREAPDLLFPFERTQVDVSCQANIESGSDRSHKVKSILTWGRVGTIGRGCAEVSKSSAAFNKRRKPVDAEDVSAAGQKAVLFATTSVPVQQRPPRTFQSKSGMRTDVEVISAVHAEAIHKYRRAC